MISLSNRLARSSGFRTLSEVEKGILARSKELERKSSAVTLSDMEMFIFPELIYSLVLANIMSPRIWRWWEDPWFDGLERMKPYRRILRVKQYIMDHYHFNLDLDTWGLTTKEQELARFRDFISPETLARSNALFGYEGDKYYFDMDIRTHFGLDKYEGDVIPYWKTETVEAMDAFQYKPDYRTGAGECVSLAALYGAALFVVAQIPLKDIYIMATPLHSQNYVDLDDGILTNNRRLVTKNMWFNGTALSAQARRALENERVTMVAHETGLIHILYEEATIDEKVYAHFEDRLKNFLRTKLNGEILGNFLRHNRDMQECFQVKWRFHGRDHYIEANRVFAYEHGSPFRVNDNTRDRLMAEIDRGEFHHTPLPRRIDFNALEDFVNQHDIDPENTGDVDRLKELFASDCLDMIDAIDNLAQFCRIHPQLPDRSKKVFTSGQKPLGIDLEMSREEVIQRLEDIREENDMAGMAFYAYRDLLRTEPEPFLLAAMDRNPVSVTGTDSLEEADLLDEIQAMPDESIYDEKGRLAQPDEVWNYQRGDGVEKAVLLANILRRKRPGEEFHIRVTPDQVFLSGAGHDVTFHSNKGLNESLWPIPPFRKGD
jgi:hypothetical protein